MTTDKRCPSCYGRGYKPERRRPSKRNPHALGFYARQCRKCGGSGVTERTKISGVRSEYAPKS